MDPARDAWSYAIAFDHVPTMTSPPESQARIGVVRYNPAGWRFAEVDVGTYHRDVRSDGGN